MPGRSDRFLERGEVLKQLTELQRAAEQRALLNPDPGFPAESDELVARVRRLIDSLGPADEAAAPTLTIEERDVPPGPGVATSRALTAADLSILREHVINLNEGQFAQDDQYSTKAEDVDRIFGQSIPDWIKQAGERKPNIVFYA